MSTQRVVIGLTLVNVVLLAFLLTDVRAREAPSVLRGRALEIVDDQGRLRASINIHTDTVVLRLIDPNGRPGAKIAASEQASGLSFVGASDSTQVQLGAQGGAASLKLANHDGRQQVFRP